MVRKKAIIVVVGIALIALMLAPQITLAAPGVSHSYGTNPGTAGESNSITFTISNPDSQQIFITSAEVTWEWRTTPYTASGPSGGVASGSSTSVTINFDVPENVPTTTQQANIAITYTTGSATGTTHTIIDTYHDFRVEPAVDIMLYVMVIVIISVVIIVVAISYIYVKKKPQVNVYKEIQQIQAPEKEPEAPATRIRAAPQRVAHDSSTAVVGYGGATQVTAAQGGLEVVFPKGTKKIVQNELIIGREDFANVVDNTLLQRISKYHLRIYNEGGKYFIEDGYRGKASTNGTKFNGREIRGAGPQQIITSSTISIADATDIQLNLNR